MPTKTEWVVAFVLPLQLTLLARYFLTATSESSDHVAPSYFKLWCFYFFLDVTYGHLFHTILLVPARWIARHLPGAVVPLSDTELVKQEESSNDTSLDWPSADVITKLPSDWVARTRPPTKERKIIATCNGIEGSEVPKKTSAKKKKSKSKNNKPNNNHQCNNNTAQSDQKSTDATKNDTYQPYYLNHVQGSTRIRQASQRIGAAMGSLLASYMICQLSGSMKLQDVGLTLPILRDLAWGFLIGLSIVTIIFFMELRFGWIKVGGFFQTVVPNESFAINFLWDVLFVFPGGLLLIPNMVFC